MPTFETHQKNIDLSTYMLNTIPSLFTTVVGALGSSVLCGAQYFDSSWLATNHLFTICDLKAATTASQVGGGSTAVSNQCFRISCSESNTSECFSQRCPVQCVGCLTPVQSCTSWHGLDEVHWAIYFQTWNCQEKIAWILRINAPASLPSPSFSSLAIHVWREPGNETTALPHILIVLFYHIQNGSA